ncbi:MAG: hypothetical protein ABI724_01315 [Betaproteobacteria bacterium]
MSAAEGVAPRPAWPWWAIAAGLLASAMAGVIVWIVMTHTGADRFANAPPFTVPGASFQLTRGGGHPDKTSFILESVQEGLAALSAEITPFSADKYPRVEWLIHTAQPPAELAFVWRTRENPRRTYSKPLRWLAGRVAPLQLTTSEGWLGTITGIALVVRGSLPAPLEVVSVRMPSTSAAATMKEVYAQWATHFPLKGYAITFPFDVERVHFLSIAMATALATGLAILAYLLLARWRGWPVDARVLWATFAAAWILLDARWQLNLGREAALAVERFSGKSADEKALAAEDAPVFVLAQDLRRSLPPPPNRVLVLSDNDLLAVRLAHFLYPQNVSRNLSGRGEGRVEVAAPDPARLRSGDYVALVLYSAIGYDAARKLLVWPGGSTKPAELILSRPDALLVRVL